MAKKLLPDVLWAEIAPLFPPDRPRPKGGRPPVGAREALIGVLFVLYTATPWERLPFEVAGCSGMTCWRRLRAWQDMGLWDKIHRHLLDRLSLAGEIWSAPHEVIHPVCWSADQLEGWSDGNKAPQAGGDRRQAASG